MKSTLHHLPHGTAGRNLMGVAVDKGERYGAAMAYGYAKGYYHDRFLWRGHGLDLWSGIGFTAGSVLLNVFSGGRSRLADHLERVGDAGIMSALGSIGTTLGARKAGRVVQVLSPGKNAGMGLPGAKKSILGHIAPAMGGSYLSPDDIARYAESR